MAVPVQDQSLVRTDDAGLIAIVAHRPDVRGGKDGDALESVKPRIGIG
jgi:hypothetical protein